MWKYEELFSQLKRALACIKEQDLNRAERLLLEIKDEMENRGECRELAGEWYLLLAMTRSYDPDQAISLLLKAKNLIGGRSKLVPVGTHMTPDVYGPLFIYLRKPGKADETGEKLERMFELYDGLCKGGHRFDHMYRGQLAFYRGEFEKAQSLLLKADGNARKSGCVLEQICAAEYRGRLAIHMKRPVEWLQAFNFICSMQKNEKRVLKEVALYTKCQMRMRVGLMSHVPEWIREGQFGVVADGPCYRIVEDNVSYSAFPIAWQTHIRYLLYSGNFTRLINAADMASSLYRLDRMPLFKSYLWLEKASAWKALGDQGKVAECVRQAVKILAPDGLWLFVAEFVPVLEEYLVKEIELFGPEALEHYRRFSKEYPVKLALIRSCMEESVFREPLTEKEQTVARLAALGFKSRELAEYLSISQNTVKYHLSNIYKKLGIGNRVELKNAMEKYMEKEYAFWTEMTKKE